MEREIIVKGHGLGRSMPDLAVIGVLVEADGATREQAYAEAAGPAQSVDEVLRNRADALSRVMTAALAVQPRSRWKRGETVRTGWRATRATTVEVTDFSQLGELIADLTSAGGAVSGPDWRIEESNPVFRQARRAAAEDARRRAEDYAGALGLVLGPVAWVSEPGLRGSSEQAGHFAGGLAVPAGGSAMARDSDEVLDVTPAEMRTTAEVEVGFTLASTDT